MQEYTNFAYFDLQKTGSTTIKALLRELVGERRPLYRSGHDGPHQDYDRAKLSFISTREPLSLYISLFNFATMEQKGNLHGMLSRAGFGHLYAPSVCAFERWLEFVLEPGNAPVLKEDYAQYAPREVIGLLSFRLLYISVPNALRKMKRDRFKEKDAIRTLYGRRVWHDHVRTENLGRDLYGFLRRPELGLEGRLGSEEEFLARLPQLNASRKIDGLAREAISPALIERVRQREWLFYEAFGYDADPKGRPPSS